MRVSTVSRSMKWCLSAAAIWIQTSENKVKFNVRCTDQQHARQRAVLRHQVGQRKNTQVDDLDAGRRAIDPTRQGNDQQQHIECAVDQDRCPSLPCRHRRQRERSAMDGAPSQAEAGDQEYGDADPLVPGVPLQFLAANGRPTIDRPTVKLPTISIAVSQCSAMAARPYCPRSESCAIGLGILHARPL